MEHVQALADALVLQRNVALNELATRTADLAVANARIAELEAQLIELTPKES